MGGQRLHEEPKGSAQRLRTHTAGSVQHPRRRLSAAPLGASRKLKKKEQKTLCFKYCF